MIPQNTFLQIQKELTALEKERDIKILFACESGSRGWGFASNDSDFDVRFIYMHSKDWYLSIEEKKDSIELPINDNLDIGGWDIRKFLRLFRKSNAVTFEWIQSPVIYINHDHFKERIFALAPQYFEPKHCINHYIGLASNSFASIKEAEETKAKKYFYVIRPILAAYWIVLKNEIPPMEYGVLLELIDDEHILNYLENLLEKKRSSNEADFIKIVPQLHDFIENIISACNAKGAEMNVKYSDSQVLNMFFRDLLL